MMISLYYRRLMPFEGRIVLVFRVVKPVGQFICRIASSTEHDDDDDDDIVLFYYRTSTFLYHL